MLNLDVLDTLIAIVVILLILSLLVQSIQSLIKKLFKLKSKEIEKSLVILFDNVIAKHERPKTPTGAGTPPPAPPAITSADLVKKVLEQFKAVGRTTTTKLKTPVLESISKEDLLKVLARVESGVLHSSHLEKFQELYKQVADLDAKIKALITDGLLQGAASAKFAEMREVLSPLINDFEAVFSGGSVKQDVLLGDLIALREVKLGDALALLAKAQEAVAKDLEAERAAKNDGAVTALKGLSAALTEIANVIGQLGQRADEAFGALRTQLDHVGNWYDTVMQSFEERYNRRMKSFSIYVSIGVVIFFNVNIIRIYRNLSTDELQRTLIVKAGEKFLDERHNAAANANSNAAGSGNTSTTNGQNANAGREAAANKLPPAVAALGKDLDVIKDYTAKYRSLGFSPLTKDHLSYWWGTFWLDPRHGQWWIYRLVDLKRMLGWALTVLLLSVGAPFWQDALESLFGVKNLLRKKSDTRNVEGESGAGQPRS